MRVVLTLILLHLCAAPLAAQHGQPYAGQQHRRIKALSDSEVRGYLNGEGMGYAKVAELNHYPGPRHVLDLAGELGLSDDQRRETQALFDRMRAEAVELGARIVAKEEELDRLFAERRIDEGRLREALHEIGRLQAELRGTHLRAHLAMRELLDEEQIARYDELRGYAQGEGVHPHHGNDHGTPHAPQASGAHPGVSIPTEERPDGSGIRPRARSVQARH